MNPTVNAEQASTVTPFIMGICTTANGDLLELRFAKREIGTIDRTKAKKAQRPEILVLASSYGPHYLNLLREACETGLLNPWELYAVGIKQKILREDKVYLAKKYGSTGDVESFAQEVTELVERVFTL